jgi:hypothetical protein
MPRSDSGDSSGGSLTSDEEVEVPRTENALAPAATLVSSETASATVAGGMTLSQGAQRFRKAVSKVGAYPKQLAFAGRLWELTRFS